MTALPWLIQKWLKAGILDTDGKVIHPATGTTQGGIVSPILANVYLHYVVDLWFHREPPTGKTRFDFLGFEFYWGKDRRGRPHLKRRTSRERLRGSLNRFAGRCRKNRNLRLRMLFRRLNAKLRGYYNYHGTIGNYASWNEFFRQAMRMPFKWLNRRSQRRSFNWQRFLELLKDLRVERPRMAGWPKTRKAASLARAGLRLRVFLKSPVRENFTPGSVRGPLGNWQSYRDDHYGENRTPGAALCGSSSCLKPRQVSLCPDEWVVQPCGKAVVILNAMSFRPKRADS